MFRHFSPFLDAFWYFSPRNMSIHIPMINFASMRDWGSPFLGPNLRFWLFSKVDFEVVWTQGRCLGFCCIWPVTNRKNHRKNNGLWTSGAKNHVKNTDFWTAGAEKHLKNNDFWTSDTNIPYKKIKDFKHHI